MKVRNTFISYSHIDKDKIMPVAEMLRVQGGKVFLDKDSIAPGTNWKKEIDKAISNSDQVILFWCCHADESEWVRYELSKGLELEKKIIPIICCGYELDENMKEIQWIDLRGVILHDCIGHADDISKEGFNTKTNIDFNTKQFPQSLKPITPNVFRKLRTPIYLILLAVLILLFFIKPFPAYFGNNLARLTNLIILLLPIAIIVIFSIIIVVEMLRKEERNVIDQYPTVENIIQEAILVTDENPYAFYPKNFRPRKFR